MVSQIIVETKIKIIGTQPKINICEIPGAGWQMVWQKSIDPFENNNNEDEKNPYRKNENYSYEKELVTKARTRKKHGQFVNCISLNDFSMMGRVIPINKDEFETPPNKFLEFLNDEYYQYNLENVTAYNHPPTITPVPPLTPTPTHTLGESLWSTTKNAFYWCKY